MGIRRGAPRPWTSPLVAGDVPRIVAGQCRLLTDYAQEMNTVVVEDLVVDEGDFCEG